MAYGGRDDGLFRGAIMESGNAIPNQVSICYERTSILMLICIVTEWNGLLRAVL